MNNMKGQCQIEPLFHATVEERKTMTRRIAKYKGHYIPSYYKVVKSKDGKFILYDEEGSPLGEISPRYKIGETVFLREPYKLTKLGDKCDGIYHLVYSIDYAFGGDSKIVDISELGIKPHKIANIFSQQARSKTGYANKLFMPAWTARYFIEITDARCERLQDISEEDCFAEGIYEWNETGFYHAGLQTNGFYSLVSKTSRKAFAHLIDSINGKGTWEKNPYVWAYTYKLIK